MIEKIRLPLHIARPCKIPLPASNCRTESGPGRNRHEKMHMIGHHDNEFRIPFAALIQMLHRIENSPCSRQQRRTVSRIRTNGHKEHRRSIVPNLRRRPRMPQRLSLRQIRIALRCRHNTGIVRYPPIFRNPPVVRSRGRTPRFRAHRPCGLAVGRDVPIAPPRHRRGARLGIPQNSHDHGARALPGRRDEDIAPYRHYTREIRAAISARVGRTPLRDNIRTQYSHANYPGALPCGAMVARGGSPPRPTAITHAIFARGVLPRHCPWRLATAATASWRAVFWRIPGWNRMRGGCRLRNGDCGACIRVGQRKQNRHSTSSNIRREESSEAPFPS